jgi:hypothetical protein
MWATWLVALTVPWQAGLDPAAQQADKRIAVLEFRGSRGVVEVDGLKLLSDKARGGALQAVAGGGYLILTRESQDAVLKQMGVCDPQEGECDLETGRNLQAHYILTGDVLKVGSRLHLTLKLFESASGRFLAEETVQGEAVDQLLAGCPKATQGLVERGLRTATSLGSQVSFAKGRRLQRPPRVKVPESAGVGQVAAVAAEEIVERALQLQDDPRATPAAQAEAWCELAVLLEPNPYASVAQEGCARWQAYLEEVKTVEAEIEPDFDKLQRFIQLKRVSPQQKVAAVDEFLKAYRPLGNHPRVREAESLRTILAGPSAKPKATPQPTVGKAASPAPGKPAPTRTVTKAAAPAPATDTTPEPIHVLLKAAAWGGVVMSVAGATVFSLGTVGVLLGAGVGVLGYFVFSDRFEILMFPFIAAGVVGLVGSLALGAILAAGGVILTASSLVALLVE